MSVVIDTLPPQRRAKFYSPTPVWFSNGRLTVMRLRLEAQRHYGDVIRARAEAVREGNAEDVEFYDDWLKDRSKDILDLDNALWQMPRHQTEEP